MSVFCWCWLYRQLDISISAGLIVPAVHRNWDYLDLFVLGTFYVQPTRPGEMSLFFENDTICISLLFFFYPNIMNKMWSFLILSICAFKQQPPLPTNSSNLTKMDLNGQEGSGALWQGGHTFVSLNIFTRLYCGGSSMCIHIFEFYVLKTVNQPLVPSSNEPNITSSHHTKAVISMFIWTWDDL